MEKPVFERKLVPITGTPDPDPGVEMRAVAAFRALEATLHRHFNNPTALNKVRGMMEALDMAVPGMPERARADISDSQREGFEQASSYVLAGDLMGELGHRYVARIGVLMIPVARDRIAMRNQTIAWSKHLRDSGK